MSTKQAYQIGIIILSAIERAVELDSAKVKI